jgi:CIC family chloride channel protein
MIYTRGFYWITHLFGKLPLPRMLKPAIGAVLSVCVGLTLYFAFGEKQIVLSVLSFGYGVLQDGFNDITQLSAGVLLAVALGKILTTSLTIGSGGSGGVFGPSMVIGGCGGGAFGLMVQHFFPDLAPNPASYMIVGMAGFFASAAKTPFSTLVIVCELTGNYHLIVPALWVCALAYLLSDEQSLYSSQVKGRSNSPAHQGDYIREVLEGQTVSLLLNDQTAVQPLHAEDRLETVVSRFDSSGRLVLPVVDGQNRLLGVVHLNEVYWTATRQQTLPWLVALDLMRGTVRPLTAEQSLERAAELFVENDLSELPVVSSDGDGKLVGMVRRTDMARAYLRRVHAQRSGIFPRP